MGSLKHSFHWLLLCVYSVQIMIRGRPVVTISNEGAQWSNPQDSPTLSPHGGWLVPLCAHDIAYLHPQSLPFAWVSHKKDMYICVFCSYLLLISTIDKAPRLSISIVIWILSSDTICQLNQFNTNSEAAMLSKKIPKNTTGLKVYVVPLKGCMNCLDKGPSQSSYLFSTIQYDLRPLARTIRAPVHYVQFVKYIFPRNRTTTN